MPRSLPLPLLLAASSLFAPALAAAQSAVHPSPVVADMRMKAPASAGDDEVSLKNGGMVRGTVTSVEPDKEVVILVGGAGNERRIPWAQVDKVQRGKYAKAGPAPAGSSQEAEAPVEAGASGAPKLHIDSTKPGLVLHEVTMSIGIIGSNGSSAYGIMSRPVCQAPCDQVVDGRSGNNFFVAGEGIPPSEGFRLSDKRGDVTLDVKAGSSGLRGGGYALIIVGGAGVVTGLTLIVLGALVGGIGPDGTRTSSSLPAAGGAVLGISAGALGGGIGMIIAGATKAKFVASSPVGSLLTTGTMRF